MLDSQVTSWLKKIVDLLTMPTADSTPNLWQRLTFAGRGFITATNIITISGTAETDFFLIRNPVGSGKSIRFKIFSIGVGGARSEIRIYRQPIITSVGTPLTLFPIKGATASVMLAYQQPTISSRGLFIEAIQVTTGSYNYDFDLARYLTQGGDTLITVKSSTGNIEHNFSGMWAEVDP